MRERCPSARFVGIAKLPDHRLVFSRRSRNRECGVADIIGCTGHDVWGVVYEISDPEDANRLDRCEGVPSHAYVKKDSQQVFLRDDPGRPFPVSMYFAVKEDNPPLPNTEYKTLIVRGAKFWQLPAVYIQELEEIATS
jgi:AIG2-like family